MWIKERKERERNRELMVEKIKERKEISENTSQIHIYEL
jgi:hypothetical protein